MGAEDDVHFTGERTREERDAEGRKRAIDLDDGDDAPPGKRRSQPSAAADGGGAAGGTDGPVRGGADEEALSVRVAVARSRLSAAMEAAYRVLLRPHLDAFAADEIDADELVRRKAAMRQAAADGAGGSGGGGGGAAGGVGGGGSVRALDATFAAYQVVSEQAAAAAQVAAAAAQAKAAAHAVLLEKLRAVEAEAVEATAEVGAEAEAAGPAGPAAGGSGGALGGAAAAPTLMQQEVLEYVQNLCKTADLEQFTIGVIQAKLLEDLKAEAGTHYDKTWLRQEVMRLVQASQDPSVAESASSSADARP